MLTKPEIGTAEHIRLWAAGKPEDEAYVFVSDNCPWAQYAKEHLEIVPNIERGDAPSTPELHYVNDMARLTPHTFGALYQRLLG